MTTSIFDDLGNLRIGDERIKALQDRAPGTQDFQNNQPSRRPKPKVAKVQIPRHKYGEGFLKGPIPNSWLDQAMAIGTRAAICTGILVWRYVGMKNNAEIVFSTGNKKFPVHRSLVRRGIHELKRAGLILVERAPGQALRVTVLDAREMTNTNDNDNSQ